MAKQLRLDVAQLTDVGRKREHNEDNMAYVIPKDPQVMAKKGALFIVADGMGGHASGEVASEIAVDTVSNVYYQDDSEDVAVSLLHAIRRANAGIHQRAAENMLRSGMGTTCVATVLRGNMAYIANVGDSRAYLVRGGQVKQISQDHSWVYEQVRAGLLTEDQARTHAQRNVITRCLGTQAEVEIDVFREQLEESDSLVLCTDGLSGLVSDDELQSIVDQFVPQESVYHLVERANENGGPDNITAIVVRIHEVGVEPPGVRHAVRVGGREMGEDATTALSGMLSSGTQLSPVNMPISSGPLHLTSGPLASHDSITAPQPVISGSLADTQSVRRRSRLFYPTLALCVLFIVTLMAGGGYYYLRSNESQVVNGSLDDAERLISKAQNEVTASPVQALADFSSAQKKLHDVQKNHQLDASQTQRFNMLRGNLFSMAKDAINGYDTNNNISLLCANTPTNAIENTSTHTQANVITSVLNTKNTPLLYAVGQDENLYQINTQNSLVSSNPFPPNSHIVAVVGSDSHLFVLSKQSKDNLIPGYSLSVFQPDQEGKLSAPVSVPIDPNLIKMGYMPGLVTAWNTNVYVVLSSGSTTNKALVLSYTFDTKKNSLSMPKSLPLSVSATIVSSAAFPDQLFLLQQDGHMQSLLLPPAQGNQSTNSPVLLASPIAPPLVTSQSNFTVNSDIPTSTQADHKGNTPLIVPGGAQSNTAILSTGLSNGVLHLYIGDAVNHRILDFTGTGGNTTSSATPTPTPTPIATNVTLQLFQQYVSANFFSMIKSVTVDPIGKISVLSQNTPSTGSLVSISTTAQSGCTI